MAFNKVSVVAFVLLVAAATAHSRPDAFEKSSMGLGQTGSFCSSCECKGGRGGICMRFDQKIGGCPFSCGEPCVCTRSIPPICSCNYQVETCDPRACGNAKMTLLDLAATMAAN